MPAREPKPTAAPPPPARKRGKPQHVPTEKTRARVTAWSGGGIELEMIAASLPNPTPDKPDKIGISVPTLTRHYKAELLTGKAMMDGLAISALGAAMQRGGKEAVVAAKWWTQSRMGWRDTLAVQNLDKDGNPANAEVIYRWADPTPPTTEPPTSGREKKQP